MSGTVTAISDRVARRDFAPSARTENSDFAAIEDAERKLYGLQFHPEVAHTPRGKEILQNFVFHICHCAMDWTMGSFIEEACARVRRQVGDEKVVLGLSGGVDSSVVAALLHKAIGDQLTCIFVNNGLLRAREEEMVQRVFGENFHVRLEIRRCQRAFSLPSFDGVTDPETEAENYRQRIHRGLSSTRPRNCRRKIRRTAARTRRLSVSSPKARFIPM